jgi:hypothetical protein
MMTNKQKFIFCTGLLLVAILLMAANQAPSVYIEKGPPHPRALIISRFIWTSALAAIAFILGGIFSSNNKILILANLVIISFSCLYFGRTAILEIQQWPRVRERAQIWDQRDLQIKQAISAGQNNVYVKAIDGATMDHTRDFKESPTFWLNACAARYYGIEEIIVGTEK